MNIKQLKAKIKNRKPMSEKKKTLLKGLLFGFLAGGLATITAVGVVGCAMNGANTQTEHAAQKSLHPRNAVLPDVDYNVDIGKVVAFVDGLPAPATFNVSGVIWFTVAGVPYQSSFTRFTYSANLANYFNFLDLSYAGYTDLSLTIGNDIDSKVRVYGTYDFGDEYITVSYCSLTFSETPDLGDYTALFESFLSNPSPDASSSSEEASGEQSTESGGASSPVETSTIEEVSKSFALQFGETNPFSAWAINPSNNAPAVNYDSAAPWLLYTGTPSSETMGSVTAKYTIYDVGAFYIDGNPAQTFDAIALTTLTLSPDNSFVVGGASEAQTVGQDAYNKGAFIVAKVHYLNTANESRVQVMDFATTSAKLGNEQVNALTGPAWLNVGFRNIVYVGDNPTLSINGYDAPAAWWLKNNALSSSAAVATMLLGNAETGVFGLLASAFSGLGGILGIAIIPGLTIGTLMFIPLVVIIIFAIIKVLNK